MQDVKDELSHIKNEMSYGVQVPYYVYAHSYSFTQTNYTWYGNVKIVLYLTKYSFEEGK